MPCFTFEDEKRDLGSLDRSLKHLYLFMKRTGHIPRRAAGVKSQFDKKTRDLSKQEGCDLDQYHVYNINYGSAKLVIDYFAIHLGLKSWTEVDTDLNEDLVMKKMVQFVMKHGEFPKPQRNRDKGWKLMEGETTNNDLSHLPLPNVYRFHFGPDMGKKRVLARVHEAQQAVALTERFETMPETATASGWEPVEMDPSKPRFRIGDTVLHELDMSLPNQPNQPVRTVYEISVIEEVHTAHTRLGIQHAYTLHNEHGKVSYRVPAQFVHDIMDLRHRARAIAERRQAQLSEHDETGSGPATGAAVAITNQGGKP